MSTSCVIAGGTAARNRVLGLRLRGNAVRSLPDADWQNSAVFVSGAQVALTDHGAAEGDHLDGLEVADTVVDGTAVGLLLAAAHVERCAECRATGSVVEHVELHGNTWRNLPSGLVLQGAAAGEIAGLVDGTRCATCGCGATRSRLDAPG